MGGDLHLLHETHLANGQGILILFDVLVDPDGCPADKVRGENGQGSCK